MDDMTRASLKRQSTRAVDAAAEAVEGLSPEHDKPRIMVLGIRAWLDQLDGPENSDDGIAGLVIGILEVMRRYGMTRAQFLTLLDKWEPIVTRIAHEIDATPPLPEAG